MLVTGKALLDGVGALTKVVEFGNRLQSTIVKPEEFAKIFDDSDDVNA